MRVLDGAGLATWVTPSPFDSFTRGHRPPGRGRSDPHWPPSSPGAVKTRRSPHPVPSRTHTIARVIRARTSHGWVSREDRVSCEPALASPASGYQGFRRERCRSSGYPRCGRVPRRSARARGEWRGRGHPVRRATADRCPMARPARVIRAMAERNYACPARAAAGRAVAVVNSRQVQDIDGGRPTGESGYSRCPGDGAVRRRGPANAPPSARCGGPSARGAADPSTPDQHHGGSRATAAATHARCAGRSRTNAAL